MYTKKNTRVTFRSNKRSNFKRNNFTNNKGKNKGNITQQYNRYLKLAKEASSSGDRVQSEYYYQFTDHYFRLMVELGIAIEDNDLNESQSNDLPDLNTDQTNDASLEEKKPDSPPTSEDTNQNDDEDLESIESIPFISEPVRKKTPRTKKVSA